MDDSRYPVEQDPVDAAEDQPAGDDPADVAEAAEDDHDQDEDRHIEAELLRRDHLEVARPDRSGEAGEAGAEREREELRRHEVDPHRCGRDFVFAHRRPRPADSRDPQTRGDHYRKEQDRDDQVVPGDRALAETEGDDREVVPSQPQRWRAQDDPEDRCDARADEHREEEVHLVALRHPGDRTLRRGEEGHRIRADGEEGGVAQVEQACEADDDVQAEREDDKERDRDGLRLPTQAEEPIDDREGERQRDPSDGDPDSPRARAARRRVPPPERRALHARSPRAWPSRPVGLKTRMITRREKTPTFSHWPPKYVTVSALRRPSTKPPRAAPLTLPMPPRTAAVNALSPASKPSVKTVLWL